MSQSAAEKIKDLREELNDALQGRERMKGMLKFCTDELKDFQFSLRTLKFGKDGVEGITEKDIKGKVDFLLHKLEDVWILS